MFLNTFSRPALLFYILLPVATFLALQFFYIKKPLTVFPSSLKDSTLKYNTYTDQGNGGNSTIAEYKKTEQDITLRYTEGTQFPYPYIGVNVTHADSTIFWDLSDYDHVSIDLSTDVGKLIPVTMGLYIPNVSQKSFLTYRQMTKDVVISKDTAEYNIPLEEFVTPAWSYQSLGGITEQTIGPPNYAKCKFIAIQSCNLIKPGIEDRIIISKISYYKDYSTLYKTFGIFTILYFAAGLVLLYIRKVKQSEVKQISIQYQSVLTENRFDMETQKVISCITRMYTNPELDLDKIQQETGISRHRISELLKESLDLNFKQFLNNLRINEAKRLLSESQLQVSEIAYQVGYGNISHFNRVFKTLEEISPVDYRKKHLDRK